MTISKLLNSTDVHTVQRKVNEIIDEINANVVFRNVEITRTSNGYCKTYDEYDSATGAFIGTWCEQGCYCDTSEASNGYTQIHFMKSYWCKNYMFTVTPLYSTAPVSDSTTVEMYSARGYKGTVVYSTDEVYGYSWKVCGYIDNTTEHDGLTVKETVFSVSSDLDFLTADDEVYSVRAN